MHTTVRRYEGIDQTRKSELAKKVGENLLPRLSKLPGFNGYYLIDAEQDVMTPSASSTPRRRPTSRLASSPAGCARRSSRTCSRIRRRSPSARSSSTR